MSAFEECARELERHSISAARFTADRLEAASQKIRSRLALTSDHGPLERYELSMISRWAIEIERLRNRADLVGAELINRDLGEAA